MTEQQPFPPHFRGLLPESEPGDFDAWLTARIDEIEDALPVPQYQPTSFEHLGGALATAVREDRREEICHLVDAHHDAGARLMVLHAACQGLDEARAIGWSLVEPENPYALMIAAAHHGTLAAALSDAGAEPGETENPALAQALASARQIAERLVALRPDDPLGYLMVYAWEPRDATAEESDARFRAWQRLDPLNYYGHVLRAGRRMSRERDVALALNLAEAMRLSEEAPPGHDCHTLVAHAMIDLFAHALMDTEDVEAGFAAVRSHAGTLAAAYERRFGVDQPSAFLGPQRNIFAFCCFAADLERRALAQLLALEGHATRFAWELLSDHPLEAWEHARRYLLRRVITEDPEIVVSGVDVLRR